jgi:hypothetical protein
MSEPRAKMYAFWHAGRAKARGRSVLIRELRTRLG